MATGSLEGADPDTRPSFAGDPVEAVGDPRRAVPRTDQLLADPRLREATARLGSLIVRSAVNQAQEACRQGDLQPHDVAGAAVDALPRTATSMVRVINATGVMVHTNLGRAPLSSAAVAALHVAAGTTDVELDLETGVRGRRGRGALEALAAAVPQAGGCLVVNNGAAALALVASGLAPGREIVVARGELVEIGDGFRIPELLEASGARLREVGTTNRVSLADYRGAIGPETALVLKVHPSNFIVEGFTSSVPVEDLATLPVPVVVDIGSGLLSSSSRLPDEPDAASTLAAGADVVTASGDKLLGGPQCGLLLGRTELVERLRRHPLARALRVDKLTLAALEATLRGPAPPVTEALRRQPEDLFRRAAVMCEAINSDTPHGHQDYAGPGGSRFADAVVTQAAVGGGGAPGVLLDSAAVSLPSSYQRMLRLGDPPVVGHVRDGRLLLDLIAVDEGDDAAVVEAVCRAAASLPDPSASLPEPSTG